MCVAVGRASGAPPPTRSAARKEAKPSSAFGTETRGLPSSQYLSQSTLAVKEQSPVPGLTSPPAGRPKRQLRYPVLSTARSGRRSAPAPTYGAHVGGCQLTVGAVHYERRALRLRQHRYREGAFAPERDFRIRILPSLKLIVRAYDIACSACRRPRSGATHKGRGSAGHNDQPDRHRQIRQQVAVSANFSHSDRRPLRRRACFEDHVVARHLNALRAGKNETT